MNAEIPWFPLDLSVIAMMEVAIFCGICWLVRTQASALAAATMIMTVAVPFAALSRIFGICLRLIVR